MTFFQRYDSFKTKSKEMSSKVFYYKPGTAKTSANGGSSHA